MNLKQFEAILHGGPRNQRRGMSQRTKERLINLGHATIHLNGVTQLAMNEVHEKCFYFGRVDASPCLVLDGYDRWLVVDFAFQEQMGAACRNANAVMQALRCNLRFRYDQTEKEIVCSYGEFLFSRFDPGDRRIFNGWPEVPMKDDLGRDCVRVFGKAEKVENGEGAVFFARGHTGDEKFSLQLHNQITLPRRMSQDAPQSEIDDLV